LAVIHNSSLIIQIANDQTANDMQKKITAKQNKQHTTEEVLACFFAELDVEAGSISLNTTPSDFMVLILSFNLSCNVLI
jgi:hypothetical protein